MRIQHNIMAMNAYRNYTNNTSAVAKNLEKLSSGYRINRAGDDAAGLAISEKMRAQITGLSAAEKNVKDGISLVKTAEGATQEIHDMLNRMVYLAEQSANGTYQDEVDREAITNEFEQLKSEINRIADSANFNGIKLLDGSLDAKAGATKVDIIGVNSTKSVGSKAAYEASAAYDSSVLVGEDDTLEYTVSMSDGKSYTAKFTLAKDSTGALSKLVAEDGTEYTLETAGTVTVAETDKFIISELNKTDLGKSYSITAANEGQIKLEAMEDGTGAPRVSAFDARITVSGAVQTPVDMAVTETTGLDAGREITATDITEYDGTNYEDAVFTINGHKFVLLTEDHDGDDLNGDANDTAMNAAKGLGSDVTILVGGQDGLTADDDNFAQNIKAIADATGLTVTDAVDEDTLTGTAAGAGIRLSAGKGNGKNGLTLQIGEDSESYNQLTVSISDMHTKALGLDGLSLGTQKGAQDAVSAIKTAINNVSQVRGTLGATQNRLEHTQNNLSTMKENIQDAESSIRDTDIAEEMMAYTKNNILVQSAQAMLAQANQVPQGVLQLLG